MTDLFTCSYRLYALDMGQPVVCSLTRPKPPRWTEAASEVFAHAPACWELTPRYTYFRQPDAGEQFEAQIARYGPGVIVQALEAIAVQYQARSLVLLCWESDWATCHRQRVARFLLEEAGVMVRELGDRLPPPEGSLF